MPLPRTTTPSSPRRPSMTDVARAAGVSQKTVSRVVNEETNVSPASRNRVERAIADLGFRPNRAARALVTSRTRTIGLISSGSTLYGPTSLAVESEKAARNAGYSVSVVHTVTDDSDEVSEAVDVLTTQGVDGIIISRPTRTHQAIRSSGSDDVPVLSLSCRAANIDENWLQVGADERTGAKVATEHLLGLGHRTVWHVAGPQDWAASMNRQDGWREALAESGCAIPEPAVNDWSAASAYTTGLKLAERHDVTAVFCANDDMAIGLICGLEAAGLAVPHDVSVVGFDDVPLAPYQHVPLTTVHQDFGEVARQGMRRLVATLDGRSLPAPRASIPTHLVLRRTTAAPHADRGPVQGVASAERALAPVAKPVQDQEDD